MERMFKAIAALILLLSVAFAEGEHDVQAQISAIDGTPDIRAPFVKAVLVNSLEIKESYSISSEHIGKQLEFLFIYSEPMNTREIPRVEFGSDAEGASKILDCKESGAWAEDRQTFAYICAVKETEMRSSFEMIITGAQGASGARLNPGPFALRIDVDTRDTQAPTVMYLSVNPAQLQAGDDYLYIIAGFSETLSNQPKISFSDPTLASGSAYLLHYRTGYPIRGNDTNCGRCGGAPYNYQFTYSVDQIGYNGTVDIAISEAKDESGNTQEQPYVAEGALSINTYPQLEVVGSSFGSPYENGIINIERMHEGKALAISAEYAGEVDTARQPSLVFDYGARNGGTVVYGPEIFRTSQQNSAEVRPLPTPKIFSCKNGNWELKDGRDERSGERYVWTQSCEFIYDSRLEYEGDIKIRIFGATDVFGREQQEHAIGTILFDTIAPKSHFLSAPDRLTRKNIASGQWGTFNLTFNEKMDWSRFNYEFAKSEGYESMLGPLNGVPGADGKSYLFSFDVNDSAMVADEAALKIGPLYDLAGNQYGPTISHAFDIDTISPGIYASRVVSGANSNNTATFRYWVGKGSLSDGDKLNGCWYMLDGVDYPLDSCPSEENPEMHVQVIGIPNGAHSIRFLGKSERAIGGSEEILFNTSATRFYLLPGGISNDFVLTKNGSAVYLRSESPAATISVPDGVTSASLDLNSVKNGSRALIPSELNISIHTPNGTILLYIPANTTINGSATWGGRLILPRIWGILNSTPDVNYTSATNHLLVFTGWLDGIAFDKPVKLVLPGQAGLFAGFQANRTNASTFTKIENCTGNAPPAEYGECKFDSGNDLAIWTWHFTTFGSYSQTPVSTTSAATAAGTTGNSNGGGNVYIPYVAPQAPAQETPAQAPEQPQAQAPSPAPTPAPAQGSLAPTPLAGEQQLVPEAPLAAALNQPPEQQSDLVASLFGANGIVTGAAPVIAVVGAVALAGGAVYMLVMNRKKQSM